MAEAQDNFKIVATIVEAKGHCSVGHKAGDSFEISCANTAGLCGTFYHQIFPSLMTLEYGGHCPWWQGDAFYAACPDPQNEITIKLEKVKA